MAPLLLTVFLLQLVIHLLNTAGAATINEMLWILYNKLPISTSKSAQDQQRLKREVLRLKRELNAVSAQDDFARWAKLRRQHDKALSEYEKSASASSASRTSFDNTINSIRWFSTNGLRFFLQYWYSRAALFWIPEGWMPGYVEWILSFPRAPRGSISIQIWGIACASVIQLAGEALTAIYVLRNKQPSAGRNAQPQASAAHSERLASTSTGGGKKEL